MNIRLLLRSSPGIVSSFCGVPHGWCRLQNGQSGWPNGRRSFGMYGTYIAGGPAAVRTRLISVSVLSRTPSGSDGTIHNRSHGRILRAGSASRCSFCLAIWAGASLCMCLFLPGAHRAIWPSLYPDANSLVMISSGGYAGAQSPTIRFHDYQSWKTSTHHLFTGVAFYQAMLKRVHIARHPGTELSIGRASDNLFDLLNVPVPAETAQRSEGGKPARLFLSEAAWHSRFGGDPHMLGSFTDIAGQRVVIAGIVARDGWPMPGQVDAWLLEDEQHLEVGAERARLRAGPRSNNRVSRAARWMAIHDCTQGGRQRSFRLHIAGATCPASLFHLSVHADCRLDHLARDHGVASGRVSAA